MTALAPDPQGHITIQEMQHFRLLFMNDKVHDNDQLIPYYTDRSIVLLNMLLSILQALTLQHLATVYQVIKLSKLECEVIVKLFAYYVLFTSKLYSVFIESSIVATDKECAGSDVEKFQNTNPNLYQKDCAKACKGVSSMYLFCLPSPSSKFCYCETSVKTTGKCEMKSAHGCIPYKYDTGSMKIS